MFELIPKTVFIDFVKYRKFFATVSFALGGVGVLLFFVMGPKWSIDFTGGTEVEFHFAQQTSIGELREALAPAGISDDQIQQLGDESRYVVRVQSEEASAAKPEEVEAVRTALEGAFGKEWIEEFKVDAEVGSRVEVIYKGDKVDLDKVTTALQVIPGVSVQGSQEDNDFYVRLPGLAEDIQKAIAAKLSDRQVEIDRADAVGPKVGGSLRTAGLMSILVSMALILVFVGVRFDFTFAPGAVLCLLHDTTITIGFFVLLRQEFGLPMISALLTLTGYSMNDTIVVYDRIRENMHKYRRTDFGDLINDAINQTLSRTIMTSTATALTMVPFVWLGGPTLREFALVMLFGIVIGTYSSIYVAAPLTMILRENSEPVKRLLGFGQGTKTGAAVKKPKPWERPRSNDKAP